MAEIIDESPVRRIGANAKWDEFAVTLDCPCPACPKAGQSHRIFVNKLKGFGKLIRVKGMLQVLKDVTVTKQDAVIFALEVASEVLEERIRKEVNKA